MDPGQEIEALETFPGRLAGSDAERRAAAHLRERLASLGRDARLESVDVWPAAYLTHALHALLAVVASAISVSAPVAGTVLAFATLASAFGDATGLFFALRRLTGRRASQNVVSGERADKPGTLLLVAHYDAERRAYLTGRQVRLDLVLYAIAAVAVCCALRVVGVEGTALAAVQFLPTAALIVAVPLLADRGLSRRAAGGTGNAAGVATVLRLAERHGGRLEHFELVVLLTGGREPFGLGMRAWLRRHRGELDPARTVVVNLDGLESGQVRFTTREGLVLPLRSHVQLVELCEEVAADSDDDPRPTRNRAASDGYSAAAARLPSITITCPGADAPDPASLERAFAFCSELLRRLDAQLGASL
jgi:hypothetical protein